MTSKTEIEFSKDDYFIKLNLYVNVSGGKRFWQVTNTVNLLANSQEKAQTAISKKLVDKFGFNKNVANAVAYTFVLIVFVKEVYYE